MKVWAMVMLSRFRFWRSRRPVSVIVPTRDADAELEECLGAVLRQRGVGPLELLVVDSGSEDDTVKVARRFGAKVLAIPRAEFNHAETRDRAVAAATSEFVLLTVQDAVLRQRDAISRLVSELERDPGLAAVSAQQVPRDDADLFGAFLVHAHNRVTRDARAAAQSPQPAMDNVCAMIRRQAWEDVRFRRIPFGEDLDFAVRARERGWRSTVSDSVRVVHSHRRPPVYHLRRNVLERVYGAPLVGDDKISSAAAEGLDAVAASAQRLFGEVEALLAAIRGSGPFVTLAAHLSAFREALAACLEPAAPSGDLAALAEAIGAASPENPIVTGRMRAELNGFLSWYVLTDFVARLQTSPEEAEDFLVKSTATVIGRIAGDAIRVSPEETTLARRLKADV
jgi:GT2 family glycosyltransferase